MTFRSIEEYVFAEGKIGYKMQDHTVNFNTVYGYLTCFAYFKEFDKGKISKEELNAYLGITIKCGFVSYAEIPKPSENNY